MTVGTAGRPGVVVVGAGFAGLAVTRGLASELVDVTVLDRNNFHTFQPLLYEVATAGLSGVDVAPAVRAILRRQPNATFRRDRVVGVDWERRHLALDGGHGVGFDFLVLAAGASVNYFGVEGAEEHAWPLYGLVDAIRLRNQVLECFEQVAAEPDRAGDGTLTFLVVGGGPTGVEMAGALVELVEVALEKDYRHLEVRRSVRVVLVEMLDRLLPSFSTSSQRHARDTLRARGVEVYLEEAVDRVEPAAVHLGSGERIPTLTTIWAAGVRANAIADSLGVQQTRGRRIVVNQDLTVPDRPYAFVVGDLGAARTPDGGVLPQLASVAMQQGRHAAEQIRRSMGGEKTTPFAYHARGAMATIGRRAAVVELRNGVKLHGTPAWLAWLVLHLVMLVGRRNRISVLVGWAWNYLTYDRAYRLIIESPEPNPSPRRPAEAPDTDS